MNLSALVLSSLGRKTLTFGGLSEIVLSVAHFYKLRRREVRVQASAFSAMESDDSAAIRQQQHRRHGCVPRKQNVVVRHWKKRCD